MLEPIARPDPHAEYERRIELRHRAAARQEQLAIRISNLRLLVFVAAVVIAWLAFKSALISTWWLLLPAMGFLPLLILHERVRHATQRLERAASYYQRGMARLENRWADTGEAGERFLDRSHPYAEDLDLFGRGSLFELICTARTRAGEETLAHWLKAPAAPDVVRARQAVVEELRERLDLREGLGILGTDVRAGINPDALAGAPVRAQRLRLTALAVGASIQRRDSLQEGVSRFYAEITRLRQLVDLTAGPLPLLFLLDELLHGTNSQDRKIGAEAIVADLVRRGAIGLLTTHDLALAHIAEVLAPHAENVHFEDFLENGRLAFDYRLRPGVVRKSNALELMRSVGLQV
jgi:DNA mismatch repair ATPase MutS